MAKAIVSDIEVKIRRQGRKVDLEMQSHPAAIRSARLAVEEFAREAGMECSEADKVGLAFNEALANVMRHGYGGAKDKPIHVGLDRRGEGPQAEIEVKIRDWATPFDPAKLPKDPPPADPDHLRPGGLGLLCMRKLMDQVVYSPLSDGMLLTMVKKVGKL